MAGGAPGGRKPQLPVPSGGEGGRALPSTAGFQRSSGGGGGGGMRWDQMGSDGISAISGEKGSPPAALTAAPPFQDGSEDPIPRADASILEPSGTASHCKSE